MPMKWQRHRLYLFWRSAGRIHSILSFHVSKWISHQIALSYDAVFFWPWCKVSPPLLHRQFSKTQTWNSIPHLKVIPSLCYNDAKQLQVHSWSKTIQTDKPMTNQTLIPNLGQVKTFDARDHAVCVSMACRLVGQRALETCWRNQCDIIWILHNLIVLVTCRLLLIFEHCRIVNLACWLQHLCHPNFILMT